jgi:hypothetical protein
MSTIRMSSRNATKALFHFVAALSTGYFSTHDDILQLSAHVPFPASRGFSGKFTHRATLSLDSWY